MLMLRILFAMLLLIHTLFAQDDPLETYIVVGLENNLALKQQQFSLEQSMEALKEARGMYFPSIDINARYSRAGGGREITIPTGQLVNPIYTALNQLLIANGMDPRFPENLPDETILFMREKEHDTGIRLVQPIIQPAIWANYGLKSNLSDIEKYQTAIYKRILITEIKRAYYNYLKALKVVDLYKKIEDLQNENLRVSEKLFDAGKATQDVIYRAKAELSRTEQEKINVENLHRQSRSYFNFILNRPLESEITVNDQISIDESADYDYESSKSHAFTHREEIIQIRSAVSAADNSAAIAQSNYYPGLSGVVEYGFQGETYSFTDQDDYWRVSLVLNWNLFKGFQDKAKLQYAHLESKKLLTKEEEIKKQIELEVERIIDNLAVAQKTIKAAEQQFKSARASFKIVRKKYEEGIAAQIEYLDAQTTLTNAAINAVISRYDYYITYAEFERITASYRL